VPATYLRGVATLRLDPASCAGCGLCALVCPRGAIAMEGGTAAIVDADACIECGACATNCVTGAVTVRAGVGCASGIINGMLGRSGDCCCVPDEGGSGGGSPCC